VNIFQQLKLLLAARGVFNNAVDQTVKETGMPAKSVFASWTLWFNLIAGAYEMLQANGTLSFIPPPWDALVIAAGNIVLRFKTTQPVKIG
jgi:hypothetical protein